MKDIYKDITHIIFDFGGIIFPLQYHEAIKRFQEIGLLDAKERLDRYTQEGIFGELEKGNITIEEFRIELEKLCQNPISIEDCQYAWLGYVGKIPREHLNALLTLKEKGYSLSLLSNTNPFVMDWARSDSFDGIGNSIKNYISSLFISYEIGELKPSRSIFKYVTKELKIDPKHILFIDDSESNILAAEKEGWKTFYSKEISDWIPLVSSLPNL